MEKPIPGLHVRPWRCCQRPLGAMENARVLRCVNQHEDPVAAQAKKVHINRMFDGKLQAAPNPGLVKHRNRLYDLCPHDRDPQT